ncbi:hypothetical protein BO99DRAFT_357538 [Aspergillus violaceofuscus CBS 115571]|uniref:HEAT repeat domain-containing protein n=1 Tax=Aspergillus violaceofuscus (strain CBS 115571) TaxID=1450538 RepID=A0A2V5ILP0_ASPV1|nr:hypothetical protein BO99DRAFT_357538 [Aspergillus violaceofuscus CBS 115571]
MTTIYQAICVELLRKDLWRREKTIDGRTLTEQQTEGLSEFEVQLHMKEEINLLEALAFHGLLASIIDFDAPVRSQIYQHLLNGNVLVPRLHESTIKEISFLRSSDATDNAQQSFHFLHLTVQEFFAARFFAKHWTTQATIHSLTLNGRTDTDIPPQVFMAREKYNVRYEVFWRFVAGFLYVGYNHQKPSEEHTAAFLEAMKNKPRDMLGPMHSKLMMRLWSEVPASNNIARLRSLRQSHYQQLARWSSFEATAYDKGELAEEAEYPDAVLYSLLKHRSSDVRLHVLNVIAQRRVSTRLTDLIASWVDQVSDDELNPVFVRILLRNCRSLSPKASEILLGHLHDESKDLRTTVWQQLLPSQNIREDIVRRLKHIDPAVRGVAALILGGRSDLSKPTFEAVAELLSDTKWSVREAAAKALRGQSELPHHVLDRVAGLLGDHHPLVRYQAHILDLLGEQPFLPPGKLLQLSERFVTSDDRIARAVVKTLVAQAHLPPPLILALTRFLDRADKALVLDATLWLLEQSELPHEALALMAGMLPTVPIPEFPAIILSRQPPLPREILNLALSAFRLATDERYAEIHEALERHDAFYRMLPQLPVHDLQRLCRIWLRRSFGERVHFYFRDGSLVVDTPDFQGAIPMPRYQRIKLRLIFRLTVVACTRASEIERARSWIRGSVAWTSSHSPWALALVAALLAVILRGVLCST